MSVYVINHMKSETVVHGYCINTLLTSMAFKVLSEGGEEIKVEREEEERES